MVIENQNESPVFIGKKDIVLNHSENGGKIVISLNAEDPDADQKGVKYKLVKSPDQEVFKITRGGELAFLKLPDFESPLDKGKNNIYDVTYKAIDSKNSKLFIEGTVKVTVEDAIESEIKTIDKRKFIAWNVDHQPYHIIMEDAVSDYMDLKYIVTDSSDPISDGHDESIKELKPTDQIIIVQQKGNSNQIYEIWYGNGLDYTTIDRERVDWIFSQDIQGVLVDRDQYLTSNSETVFYESEKERLMAGYGSRFSVWHLNNFKLSLLSLSMRSNLLQYAFNMSVGNELVGLPGLLGGSTELGIATRQSEFGFRLPISFDFGASGYDNKDALLSSEYLGLYARGNIENIFSTNADFHGLLGFSFYPSSSGIELTTPGDLDPSSDLSIIRDSTTNINILDSYALGSSSVEVPIKLPFIGRITAAPGFHYIKVAHRLKDGRKIASKSNQDLYDRTYWNQTIIEYDLSLIHI